MKRILLTTLIALLLSSCEKDGFPTRKKGVLKDFDGLDACSWVIEVERSGGELELLDPTNLDKFCIDKSDGLPVVVEYVNTGGISSCMVGPVVKLIAIRKR